MVLEVCGIAVVFVEMSDDVLFPRPQIDIVLGVAEMRSKARAKVACAEDEDLGRTGWLPLCVIHGQTT